MTCLNSPSYFHVYFISSPCVLPLATDSRGALGAVCRRNYDIKDTLSPHPETMYKADRLYEGLAHAWDA